MSYRPNPLFWSFHVGTMARVRVRVSWLFPVVLLFFGLKFGFALGVALWSILLVSVLLHEFGHVFVARATGGSGDEILLWPLGGLAFVSTASSARSQVYTAAGGPLVNFVICALSLPLIWYSSSYATYYPAIFNPLEIPIVEGTFGKDYGTQIPVLVFYLNYVLFLVSLIPAYPLDGGRIVRSLLAGNPRIGGANATEYSLRIAYATAFLLWLGAMVLDNMLILNLAFLIVVLAMLEQQQIQTGDTYEDSFMGYDFSQGYTSLERSDRKEVEPQPGLLQRWLDRRRQEKRRRSEEQQQQAEVQLDVLLAKVHQFGIGALTEAEKRQLKRASDRYRSKDKPQT